MPDILDFVSDAKKNSEEMLINFYRFELTPDGKGYKVSVLDRTRRDYPDLPDTIYGKPIISLEGTFAGCDKMTLAPRLPANCMNYSYAFAQCTSLRVLPMVCNKDKAINIEGIFADCIGLGQVRDHRATENTKIIVANIADSGLVKDVRETTVKNIMYMFNANITNDELKTVGFYDTDSVLKILSSKNTTGVIEIGTVDLKTDENYSTNTTLCIIASETYNGGQNMSNLISLNIDPFKLQNNRVSDSYNLAKVCNQVAVSIGGKNTIPALLNVEQHSVYKVSGKVNRHNSVENRNIQISPPSKTFVI